MKALESDSVSILSSKVLKAGETTNQWMDRVAKAFAYERRYFVQVTSDDLHNASQHVTQIDAHNLINVLMII